MTVDTALRNLTLYILKRMALPENVLEDGTPNWNFLDADIHIGYEGEFNDEMIEQAFDLIIHLSQEQRSATSRGKEIFPYISRSYVA
jgi:hypothetical protein